MSTWPARGQGRLRLSARGACRATQGAAAASGTSQTFFYIDIVRRETRNMTWLAGGDPHEHGT